MLLLSLATLLNSSCVVPSYQPGIVLPLPPRPALSACPEDPGVQGKVTDRGTVELTLPEALKLRRYIDALHICRAEHEIVLDGHIEKLENRLRALGAK